MAVGFGKCIALQRAVSVAKPGLVIVERLPNAVDPSGNREYNYVYQTAKKKLRFENVGRVDVNIRPGSTFYSRLQLGHEVNDRG